MPWLCSCLQSAITTRASDQGDPEDGCGCQCHADGVGWLAPRLVLPSWLVSLVRLVDARGPADLA